VGAGPFRLLSDPFTTSRRSRAYRSGMTIDARLDAIGIVASDMAKSLAFYRALGLAVPDGAENEPHVEVPLGGGMRLLFDTEETVRSFHPAWRAVPGAGRIGLAVALPDAAAVDAAYAELTAAGHHGELEPFDAFWGQRYAGVQDPDGNGVDLYAPLAS
jgi:catechol 2,3-dioxygenase-like lactoylglutathione lyase family enzyme